VRLNETVCVEAMGAFIFILMFKRFVRDASQLDLLQRNFLPLVVRSTSFTVSSHKLHRIRYLDELLHILALGSSCKATSFNSKKLFPPHHFCVMFIPQIFL
jgi:hypothetical protein